MPDEKRRNESCQPQIRGDCGLSRSWNTEAQTLWCQIRQRVTRRMTIPIGQKGFLFRYLEQTIPLPNLFYPRPDFFSGSFDERS